MYEKQIEQSVSRYASDRGWYVRKWSSPNHRFVPDRIFISPTGKVLFIEFKRPGGKVSSGQIRELTRLRDHGQDTHVIDDVTVGKKLIDSFE